MPILKTAMPKPDLTITNFEGAYEFLALEFPCKVTYEGVEYANAATLFYSLRATNERSREKIARLSPMKARQKSSALPENPDYDDNREFYLRLANKVKFDSNLTLKTLLMKTVGRKLVNNVTHRDTWIGVRPDGRGENALGNALMDLREEYAKSAPKPANKTKGFSVSTKSKAKPV